MRYLVKEDANFSPIEKAFAVCHELKDAWAIKLQVEKNNPGMLVEVAYIETLDYMNGPDDCPGC